MAEMRIFNDSRLEHFYNKGYTYVKMCYPNGRRIVMSINEANKRLPDGVVNIFPYDMEVK